MITYIQGTDREFQLRSVFSDSGEPKDLSAFVGLTDASLSLSLPGEDGTIVLTLDQASTEGYLEVTDASSGLAGKIKVVIKDTSTLMSGEKQDMELRIQEGAGPDFQVSCVQFKRSLYVEEKLFA